MRARWSLVFGLFGLVLFVFVAVVPSVAIVLGIKARQQIAASRGGLSGTREATAGVVLGCVGVVLFLVVGVISYASTRGQVTIQQLEEGQCVDLPTDITGRVVNSLKKQSCSGPHDGEVFEVGELAAGGYPVGAQATALDLCAIALERITGHPFAESGYGIYVTTPLPANWDRDHQFSCIVYLADRAPLVGAFLEAGA